MRMRDIQMYLDKFTDGNKGTAISDCDVYIEMQDGTLEKISKMELQESRMIGKINSSAAWRVVLKGEPKSKTNQSLTFKI
jgi:hypothetical protein|tara:strand:- start:580 stop:819 length:240 start_codon:yes stop_codon:yes gene_type:complete